MTRTATMISTPKKPLRLTVALSNLVKAVMFNAKSVGELSRHEPIHCSTPVSAMVVSDLSTMSASSSGLNKRWQSKRKPVM